MRTKRLEGRTALVTGAARGIGRAIALALAAEGARVAVNYRTHETEAKEVLERIAAAGGEGMLLEADVSDGAEARGLVRRVLDVWEHLDILVNNAEITRDGLLRKLSDDAWREVMETNLNSVFYCTTAAMPAMMNSRYGRIVNVASFVGQAGNFGQANYSASKGGIIAFTKTAAVELAKFNITVNAVAPGLTATDMLAKVPPDVQALLKARIPMGRFAEPEEIAKAVLFLVAEADYVTGQQLSVNGGIYM